MVFGSGCIYVKGSECTPGWHALGSINHKPTNHTVVPYMDSYSGYLTGILEISTAGNVRFFTNTDRTAVDYMTLHFTIAYYCGNN